MNKNFFLDKEKLAEILHFYSLSIANFNRRIGCKNQELYQISAGNQAEFSRTMLKAICKGCPEVSPYWLVTGEGSMLAGSIEQHNVNGDNVGQQTNGNPDASKMLETISKQADVIARQHDTIATLASKL